MNFNEEVKLFFVLISFALFTLNHSYKCLSCYHGCPDMYSCECLNSTTSTCEGDYCFVKIRQVERDSEDSIIFKGCSDHVPNDLIGCQYAGDKLSLDCYCRGNLCNNARTLEAYQPKAQPSVSCCACDPLNEEEDIGCSPTDCVRFCTGHFCYVDRAKQTQGCGLGYPKDFSLYRTKSLDIWNSPSYWNNSCALSVAGPPDLSSWHRQCTCREDNCNSIQSAYEHDSNYTQADDVLYCHSFVDASLKHITMDSYKKSTYCSGHYCYVTVQTSPMLTPVENVGSIQLKFEIFAGCLLVDNETKVSTGCTTEWSGDKTTPYKKHCVCDSDYCNLFTMITGESKLKYRVFNALGVGSAITIKTCLVLILISLFINLIFQ